MRVAAPRGILPLLAKAPLINRLYQEPALYELARLVGYDGLPVPKAKERLEAMCKTYTKEIMSAAAEDIVRVDATTDPPTARLKDEARKACFMLLGPPPESPVYERMYGPPPAEPKNEPEEKVIEKKPKRPRRRVVPVDS